MAHTTSSTMQFLNKFFGHHILSQPLRSPCCLDLRLSDFYLWSYMKDKVLKPTLSILALQACIKVHPHYATWQNATICSFAAQQKLLDIYRQFDRVHIKKEFLANITKTVERDQRSPSDFFLQLADVILKPLNYHMPCSKHLMRPTFCRSNFHVAWHVAAYLPYLSRRHLPCARPYFVAFCWVA